MRASELPRLPMRQHVAVYQVAVAVRLYSPRLAKSSSRIKGLPAFALFMEDAMRTTSHAAHWGAIPFQ